MNPGTAGPPVNPSAVVEVIGLVSLVVGILIGGVLGGVWAWLHSRVVVAIPQAHRRVHPRTFWMLFAATALASVALAIFRQQFQPPQDGVMRVALWTIALELLASAFWITLVWYVCRGIPTGLAAMHRESNPEGPLLDHGRNIGVAVGVLTTIAAAASLSTSLYVWSVGGVPAQSGVLVGVGCGSSLLGIAWLVLTIVFLVTISRSARGPVVVDPAVAARSTPPRRPEEILRTGAGSNED